jgi:hypothetical protein
VAERIRSIEKFRDLFRNQTYNLLPCSIVTEPTMLPRALANYWCTAEIGRLIGKAVSVVGSVKVLNYLHLRFLPV